MDTSSGNNAGDMMDDFPIHGIQLRFILTEFLSRHGGREKFVGLTTKEVCETIIKPATESCKLSYCEMLLQENDTSVFVSPAKVFISHAWGKQFLEMLDALFYHFESNLDVIVWIDTLSNNQHKNDDRKFEWWTTTFKDAIALMGHTVIVLSPWNNPEPLTRAWCLWEIYSTAATKSTFEVAMSREQRNFSKM